MHIVRRQRRPLTPVDLLPGNGIDRYAPRHTVGQEKPLEDIDLISARRRLGHVRKLLPIKVLGRRMKRDALTTEQCAQGDERGNNYNFEHHFAPHCV